LEDPSSRQASSPEQSECIEQERRWHSAAESQSLSGITPNLTNTVHSELGNKWKEDEFDMSHARVNVVFK